MIVKFFKDSGKGSPKASINYLLGKNRDREHARILRGNPDLSAELAESLNTKHKYTVGCLSFKEQDIDENAKEKIMDGFEHAIFAGLEPHQYDICWIEHKDKDRLELNFFIPKVELTTGKSYNPYYVGTDFKLVDTWQQYANEFFKLADPKDPKNKQGLTTNKNLPKDKQEFKQTINSNIAKQIQDGKIKNRADVVKYLTDNGIAVTRQVKTSISVQQEGQQQNIRLKGAFYAQDFDASTMTADALAEQSQSYLQERACSTFQEQYSSLRQTKINYNQKRYKQPSDALDAPSPPKPLKKAIKEPYGRLQQEIRASIDTIRERTPSPTDGQRQSNSELDADNSDLERHFELVKRAVKAREARQRKLDEYRQRTAKADAECKQRNATADSQTAKCLEQIEPRERAVEQNATEHVARLQQLGEAYNHLEQADGRIRQKFIGFSIPRQAVQLQGVGHRLSREEKGEFAEVAPISQLALIMQKLKRDKELSNSLSMK